MKLAVDDYAANGVLTDFAHLVGFHGSVKALTKQMRKRLVVAPVLSKVVTANHGCNGEGEWFAVGPRTLNRGELVGVKVPAKLRAHLCGRLRHKGCKRVVLSAKTVFPITCWNPNMGSVKVVLYIHRKKKRKSKHHVKPKKEEAAPTPEEKPAPEKPVPSLPEAVVTTPAPAAAAVLQCGEGGYVSVTLSNASSATADASFLVNGTSHGPFAPGGSESAKLPLAPGESLTLTVISGSQTLIAAQQITNTCKAEPTVSFKPLVCREEESEYEYEPGQKESFPTGEAEVTVVLSNSAGATLPASFLVEWTKPATELEGPKATSESYGPLAPGESKELMLITEARSGVTPVKVFSPAGHLLVEEAFPETEEEEEHLGPRCQVPE